MLDLDLTGRHALVCGASQGIGRATAFALAELGADVTVLARSRELIEAIAATLPKRGAQRHGFLALDLRDRAALRAKLGELVAAHPVAILVNNTGGPPGGPAHKAGEQEFVDAFEAHLLAAQALVATVLPGMRAARHGRIVNVISTSVKEPIRNLGVSNTIRGAMASWAKTLATELAADGITVNNVLPGYTKTQRLEQILADRSAATGKTREEVAATMLASVPAARFAEPEEIAGVIAFLASPAASYVNGINVPVDGGRTLSL